MYGQFNEQSKEVWDFARCMRTDGSAYGTAGQCRKGVEVSALDVLRGGIKGRVPRNDPKEPLAGGSTPLEKAKEKLKLFEQRISDPNRAPSVRELEQFGKLQMAVREFENKRDGQKKGLFGQQDKSDIDTSKTRQSGKEIRRLFPRVEDRQALVRARQIYKGYLRDEDPVLRRRSKATAEEVFELERRSKKVSDTRERLESMLKSLPRNADFNTRVKLENLVRGMKKAEASYSKAVKRLA
jgi:hypothetical protein